MNKTLSTTRRILAVSLLSAVVGVGVGTHFVSVPAASVTNPPAVVFQPADAGQTSQDGLSSPSATDTQASPTASAGDPTASSSPSDVPTPVQDTPDPTLPPVQSTPDPTSTPEPTPVPCDTSPQWSSSLSSVPVPNTFGAGWMLGNDVTVSKDIGSLPASCRELFITVDFEPVVASDGTTLSGVRTQVWCNGIGHTYTSSNVISCLPRGEATVQIVTDGNAQFSMAWTTS